MATAGLKSLSPQESQADAEHRRPSTASVSRVILRLAVASAISFGRGSSLSPRAMSAVAARGTELTIEVYSDMA